MKFLGFIFLVAAMAMGLGGAAVANGEPPTDPEVAAHRAALDLAGAFTNDGFKLRDGAYYATVKGGQSTVVQVNLYAGNQYWFTVSGGDSKSTFAVSVYDETGKLVKTDSYTSPADVTAKSAAPTNPDPDANGTNRAAAGFAPEAGGPYYIRIANSAGAPATYCLIYSYK
jgi:hypothetical protein